ncbi:MAG: hypothetical protein WBD31_13650 [Rubripirellula sp.]
MKDFVLDGFRFDSVTGVINIPTRQVVAYRTATSPHVGLQILSERSEPSVITVKRYDPIDNQDTIKRDLVKREGNIATLVIGDLIYLYPPHELRFAILKIELLTVDAIPSVLTYRNSQTYSHSPASRIVAKITIQAQPAYEKTT